MSSSGDTHGWRHSLLLSLLVWHISYHFFSVIYFLLFATFWILAYKFACILLIFPQLSPSIQWLQKTSCDYPAFVARTPKKKKKKEMTYPQTARRCKKRRTIRWGAGSDGDVPDSLEYIFNWPQFVPLTLVKYSGVFLPRHIIDCFNASDDLYRH